MEEDEEVENEVLESTLSENNSNEEENVMANETEITPIKRSQYANMMQINNKYVRMGKGISEYKKTMNASTSDDQWIDEDSPTHEIESYDPSYDATQKCYKGEPIFEFLYPLYRQRATGAKAHVNVADVYIFDKNQDGSYPTDVSDATIEFKDFDGKELSYTVKLNGNPTSGKMVISAEDHTGAFTEDSE